MGAKLQLIVNKIIPVLKKHQVKRASVFGSFARGEARRNSDIDILVEMPEAASLFDLVGLKSDLEKKIKITVDLLTYRSVHNLIKKHVKKDELQIYATRG